MILNCSIKVWNFKILDNKINLNKFLPQNVLSNWEKKCLINCLNILLSITTITSYNMDMIESSIVAINLAFDYYHYEIKEFLINSEFWFVFG